MAATRLAISRRRLFCYRGAVTLTLDLSRAAPAAPAPVNLSGMTREELAAALVESGVVEQRQARMRATQIWRWVHHFGVTDFDRMTDIGKDARAAIAQRFTVARPEIIERQVSADGTRKWLLRTAPGIE